MASLLAALCSTSNHARAQVYTFDRQRVSTSIEGVAVDLYLSGPVSVELAPEGLEGIFDVTVDLSDFQRKLARVLEARASSTVHPCDERVLSLRNAKVSPVDTEAGVAAEVRAEAVYVTTRCAGGTEQSTADPIRIHVRPLVSAGELSFELMDARVSGGSRPPWQPSQSEIARQIAASFGAATGGRTVVAPLSTDAAALHPRVESAAFAILPGGSLGARLSVSLELTLGLIQEWIGAGR